MHRDVGTSLLGRAIDGLSRGGRKPSCWASAGSKLVMVLGFNAGHAERLVGWSKLDANKNGPQFGLFIGLQKGLKLGLNLGS